MSDRISVLLADDNIEYGSLLKEYLCQYNDIEVKGIALDGLQTIEMIKTLKPEVVILDIIMPNLDGIGVLEKLSEINIDNKPLFIILSAIGQEVFIHRAISLGAEYYILKPFDVEVLVKRIRQIYRERYVFPVTFEKDKLKNNKLDKISTKPDAEHKARSPEMVVTELINRAGILPNVSGYQYLRDAILMVADNPSMFYSISKMIYPNIAKKYDTTPRRVERAIRCAISGAWAKGCFSNEDRLGGVLLAQDGGKPTNSKFISILADMAREMNKK